MKSAWPLAPAFLVTLLALPNIAPAQTTNPQRLAFEFPAGEFPILSWDLPHWSDTAFSSAEHGLGSLKQCRFNTAAFVRPHHLAEAQKLGLWCILAPQDFPVPWRKLSDEQIESTVKQLVDSAGGNNVVIGYFLADEPGAPDFPALAKAVAAVKRLAPGKSNWKLLARTKQKMTGPAPSSSTIIGSTLSPTIQPARAPSIFAPTLISNPGTGPTPLTVSPTSLLNFLRPSLLRERAGGWPIITSAPASLKT